MINKNYHIILKEDELYLADLPEEPIRIPFSKNYEFESKFRDNANGLYEAQLVIFKKLKDQAIEDAVKLRNQELAMRLFLFHSGEKDVAERNKPYKVDLSGYDVTFEDTCTGSIFGNCDDRCRDCADNGRWENIAVLTPKKEKTYKAKEAVENLIDEWAKSIKEENSAHPFTEEPINAEKQKVQLCANWLKLCLELGWNKSDLDGLQKLWMDNHDYKGNFVPASQPSVIEESQEELWKEVDQLIMFSSGPPTMIVRNHFTITRKPKTTK